MNYLKELTNPNSELNSQQCENLEKMLGMRGEFEFELDTSAINQDAIDIIFKGEKPIKEREFTLEFEMQTQARKHKKKRINKKWLKKYGLKTETIKSDGWRFVGNEMDSVCEMVRCEHGR